MDKRQQVQERKARTVEWDTALVEIPLGEYDAAKCYAGQVINLRLSTDHAAKLKRIECGLVASGATLRNGSPIHSQYDAIRWLCEQVA